MAQVSPSTTPRARGNEAADAAAGRASAEPCGLKEEAAKSAPAPEPFVMRWLTTLTVTGCAIGIAVGILCRAAEASQDTVELIRFPGLLFVRGLKAIVVPMVFSSMVSNMGSLYVSGTARKMTRLVILFYGCTTVLAASQSLILFNLFKSAFHPMEAPAAAPAGGMNTDRVKVTILDILTQFGKDLVPDNIFAALLHTKLLSVITFSVFLGVALARTPGGKAVIDFFDTCFNALIYMIRQVIMLTPFCICSLVAGAIATSTTTSTIVADLGILFVVVLIGQGFQVFVVYTSLYGAFCKRNPFKYLAGMPRMWLTAFGTSSSAATLSVTCQCCEDLGVNRKAINFALPLGCTVNMDGSTLERPISVLWCLLVAGQPITLATQLSVALTSALLSIGSSPIPSAGLTTLMLLVDASGVEVTPAVEAVMGLLFAVEWLLDSIRTMVNVTGDAVGVAILDELITDWPTDDEAEDAACRA